MLDINQIDALTIDELFLLEDTLAIVKEAKKAAKLIQDAIDFYLTSNDVTEAKVWEYNDGCAHLCSNKRWTFEDSSYKYSFVCTEKEICRYFLAEYRMNNNLVSPDDIFALGDAETSKIFKKFLESQLYIQSLMHN